MRCYRSIIMPELPEVETVMRGLKPHLENACITKVLVRQPRLRWPVPQTISESLSHQTIGTLSRRAKYLLVPVQSGTLIIHLGMSGSLRIVHKDTAPQKHDHIDMVLNNQQILRYTDPRRFGAWLWTQANPLQHPLLSTLGPEPLTTAFSVDYLLHAIANRRKSIKELIMDNHIVVGVGNIYAAEALFLANIHPLRSANSLSPSECEQLIHSIKQVLQSAINQGGTTIKDFINSEGKPGYFSQELQVYGRQGLNCRVCQTVLQSKKIGQRSTVYCTQCQK